MKTKILFITWDGPQTTYMEGLFMPIFAAVQNLHPKYEFHVVQFTWGDKIRIQKTKDAAAAMNIVYTPVKIRRKPHPAIGSFYTLILGSNIIKKYVKENEISIVMPRSNFPASMVNNIRNRNFKILFDADGLPLEERVDFGGLSRNSLQYKWLKKQETKMLKNANAVITRSQKSIDVHLKTIGKSYRSKFSVVFNGRDTEFFKPDLNVRIKYRKELGFLENEKIFVFCGSLGIQYGWDEMIDIFIKYVKHHPAKFLILTGNTQYATERIPREIISMVLVRQVPFQEVPNYLNTADVAFAIRQPTFSMQGVAPIKLGEYLLMGLPTIASSGIGDTDEILNETPFCYIYHHRNEENDMVLSWIRELSKINNEAIREKALKYFSLEAAADTYLEALEKINNNVY